MGVSVKNEGLSALRRDQLASQGAVAALGLIAGKQLATEGACVFYIDSEGLVQTVPLWEITLDALPEPMALEALILRRYTDEELELYLRGRDARSRLFG